MPVFENVLATAGGERGGVAAALLFVDSGGGGVARPDGSHGCGSRL